MKHIYLSFSCFILILLTSQTQATSVPSYVPVPVPAPSLPTIPVAEPSPGPIPPPTPPIIPPGYPAPIPAPSPVPSPSPEPEPIPVPAPAPQGPEPSPASPVPGPVPAPGPYEASPSPSEEPVPAPSPAPIVIPPAGTTFAMFTTYLSNIIAGENYILEFLASPDVTNVDIIFHPGFPIPVTMQLSAASGSFEWAVKISWAGDHSIEIRASDDHSISNTRQITILDSCTVQECNGHGTCIPRTGGMCACNGNWKGPHCEETPCTEQTCIHGTCIPSNNVNGVVCDCEDGFEDSYCDYSEDCGINCINGILMECDEPCVCEENWEGDICTVCDLECENNGETDVDCTTCECPEQSGYWGIECKETYILVKFVIHVDWDDAQKAGMADPIFSEELINILASQLGISPERLFIDRVDELSDSVLLTVQIRDGLWPQEDSAEDVAEELLAQLQDPDSELNSGDSVTGRVDADSFVIMSIGPDPETEVEESDLRSEEGPEEDEGLEWWVGLIIALVILSVLVVCFMCYKYHSANKEDPTEVQMAARPDKVSGEDGQSTSESSMTRV